MGRKPAICIIAKLLRSRRLLPQCATGVTTMQHGDFHPLLAKSCKPPQTSIAKLQ